MALSDNGVAGLGDLKRKLVESLREYAEKYEIDDERTFSPAIVRNRLEHDLHHDLAKQ